jgi:hypothetical protein
VVAILGASALGLGASAASAHFERPGAFPDPAPDTSVSPPAGGQVPGYRRSGRVRVVCQPGSLRRANRRGATGEQMARNRGLMRRCRYSSIQSAVKAARNGDRVFVLPGVYRENRSRRQPTFDERCAEHRVRSEEQDPGEEPQALSYKYQATCPNDQNLIAVIGRHPETGRCIRCNLQIVGTGRRPGDVFIDSAKRRKLQGKDVGLRGDRADGLFVRNMKITGAAEHGFYVIESDGYALRDVIASRNGHYGFLTFVSDHGLHRDCEAYLNANAGVYPGAAPDSRPRLNQRLTRCNSHHNVLGYSGTMGNNILVENSEFHHNTVGINMDSFLAAGHPGYPQDSSVFRNNRIYSNNFNPYVEGSPLKASYPFPVGTGIFIAGGNDNLVEGNYIYDNWRRGTMLITVPGFVATPPQQDPDSTSHRNVQRRNHMAMSPDGRRMPNGVDFWWDEAGRENCWEDNGPATSDPAPLDPCPGRQVNAPALGNPNKQAVLAACATWPSPAADARCDWFTTPPRPASGAARASRASLCRPLGPGRCAQERTEKSRPGWSAPVNARQTCAEWNRSSARDRRSVLGGLRAALAADAQFRGIRVVPQRDALDHMNRTCRHPVATGFSLFEVFTHQATYHAAPRRGSILGTR